MFLPPPPLSIQLGSEKYSLDEFAKQYGNKTKIIDYQTMEYLEVYQLDFSLIYSLIYYHPKYKQDSKIPAHLWEEYCMSIWQHPYGHKMVENGAQYNIPINGNWISYKHKE